MATYLERIIEEVEDGLPNDRGIGLPGAAESRIYRAEKARKFYNFDGRMYISEFLNDAETAADYIRRPYRQGGLTRMVADILCEHLYSPGPHRGWDDAESDAFLTRVYEDNHINALMQRAEVISTIMNCAAIQIDAGAGRYDDRPISLYLWGADEFVVWPEPNDRLEPFALCTIDRYDLQTRMRLYTAEKVYTFLTDRSEEMRGGRTAVMVGPPEDNPYGRLPFAFVHYTYPVNDFWEPGIGDYLVDGEIHYNNGLSRLAQSIYKHLNPIPIAYDCPDNLQIILGQPNMFLRINRRPMAPGAEGAFGSGGSPDPRLEYLQATPDVQAAWEDLHAFVDQILEACRVPRSAVRMEQTGVASGIALIVEQAPLLTRARRRQLPFGIYEEELARAILACAGTFYNRRGLVDKSRTGRMTCNWPLPSIPVQTDDWLQLQLLREQAGLTSKIMITMETFNMSRRDAIEYLEQVREDREELAEMGVQPGLEEEEEAEGEEEEEEPEGDEEGEGEGDEEEEEGPGFEPNR